MLLSWLRTLKPKLTSANFSCLLIKVPSKRHSLLSPLNISGMRKAPLNQAITSAMFQTVDKVD
ncbi:Uncharacterised protein [Yersinia aleksiciae]|uniref:Uncharacterized protein n=1 Tax=Yersinia aleksiciae TaxID=263819 RepID=A0A0T9THT8_YERAE|nr:Uncharacterised protein [Yersinia aleksiciae]CNK84130.1 Uncharacterised protein [Yersinia aleksiciae]